MCFLVLLFDTREPRHGMSSAGSKGRKGQLAAAAARARLMRAAEFDDLMDGIIANYKKLPAIPDIHGRLPGQKKENKKVVVHLPPLDPVRFPQLYNPEPNGLSIDPYDTKNRRKHLVEEEDDTAEKSVSERLAAALRANAARVLDLFRQWDENGDGEVSREEFMQAFAEEDRLMTGLSVSMQEATLLFDEWDTDGSGTISFQELKKCLKKKRKPTEPARRVRHGGVRLKPIPQGSTDGVGDAAAPAAPAAAAPAAAAPPPESAHLLEPEREPEPEPEAQPPE